mmetsp:Transcript_14115/g.10171  ORF Transcript_14115/g.10171 Transcript_14115/m.10171 type:complete len:126 (+) Transcript_14115:107-484(+)
MKEFSPYQSISSDPRGAKSFWVRVKTLNGSDTVIHCREETLVLELKELVEEAFKVPVEEQRLIMGNQVMALDHMPLRHYNVKHQQTIFMTPSYKGGYVYNVKLNFDGGKKLTIEIIEMNRNCTIF